MSEKINKIKKNIKVVKIIFWQEFKNYFNTPIASVFLVSFLFLAGIMTFYVGMFFERNQADLQAFFTFLPWLFMLITPALSMRLWANEYILGTIELVMTSGIAPMYWVVGKFLASFMMMGLILVGSFSLWISVNILGNPDNGVIIASYLVSWLISGVYLASGGLMSALSKNQVIAFVSSLVVGFLLMVSSLPFVLMAMDMIVPDVVVGIIKNFSLLSKFETISTGLLTLDDLIYFCVMIVGFLWATKLVLENKYT